MSVRLKIGGYILRTEARQKSSTQRTLRNCFWNSQSLVKRLLFQSTFLLYQKDTLSQVICPNQPSDFHHSLYLHSSLKSEASTTRTQSSSRVHPKVYSSRYLKRRPHLNLPPILPSSHAHLPPSSRCRPSSAAAPRSP